MNEVGIWFGNLSNVIGLIGTITGIIGMYFAILAFRESESIKKGITKEKERLNEDVSVTLVESNKNRRIKLPSKLRRQEVTRAELQGRLGVIPMESSGAQQPRYSIRYMNTKEYLEDIDKISEGSGESELTIICETDEIEQFDLTKLREQKLLTETKTPKILSNA